jgi:hypothetical protein
MTRPTSCYRAAGAAQLDLLHEPRPDDPLQELLTRTSCLQLEPLPEPPGHEAAPRTAHQGRATREPLTRRAVPDAPDQLELRLSAAMPVSSKAP